MNYLIKKIKKDIKILYDNTKEPESDLMKIVKKLCDEMEWKWYDNKIYINQFIIKDIFALLWAKLTVKEGKNV